MKQNYKYYNYIQHGTLIFYRQVQHIANFLCALSHVDKFCLGLHDQSFYNKTVQTQLTLVIPTTQVHIEYNMTDFYTSWSPSCKMPFWLNHSKLVKMVKKADFAIRAYFLKNCSVTFFHIVNITIGVVS